MATHVKNWDWLFLKTTGLIFIGGAIRSFFDGKWGIGIFLLLPPFFGVGGMGQSLYPEVTIRERATDKDILTDNRDDNYYYSISKALNKLVLLQFIVMAVVAFFNDCTLWKIIIISALLPTYVVVGSIIYFGIIGILHRRRKSL